MTIKMKKFIMTAVMCMLFVTTVYAVDAIPYTQVNKKAYVNCTTTTKTSAKDAALIQLTQGPVKDKCAIHVQLVRTDNSNYVSDIRLFTECGYKEADYGFNPTTYSQYYGKTFYVKAKVYSNSEYAVNIVSGMVAP